MPARDRSLLRTLAVAAHRLVGGGWYLLGRYDRARRHFERVLELKGDDFSAYVHLGRVAYKQGDYAGWRRECGHARRTSPGRYSRLKHPFELFEPRSVDGGERASWRPFRLSEVGSSPRPQTAGAPRGLSPCRGEHVQRFGDDFSSHEEREKFRELPPIGASDVRSVDLDELVRQLGD